MDLKMMIDSLSEIGLTDEQKRTARKLYERQESSITWVRMRNLSDILRSAGAA